MRQKMSRWQGDEVQLARLIKIIDSNCTGDPGGCEVHRAFLFEQRFIDGLLFGSHLRERLLAEEGLPACTDLRTSGTSCDLA